MSKYVKNDSGATDTWVGQQLANAGIYQMNEFDSIPWVVQSNTSGSKVETDVLSGDLKVSNDNFATTMSAADGLAYLKGFNADCIRGVIVDDTAKADGSALVYKSSSDKFEYGAVAANFDLLGFDYDGDLLCDDEFNPIELLE